MLKLLTYGLFIFILNNIMVTVGEIRRKIEEIGVTPYKISDGTNISQATLSRILSGKTKNPNQSTLNEIWNFLNNTYTSNHLNSDVKDLNPESMFKKKLRNYLKIKGISQSELSEIIGDTQQAVSDFLSNDGNPQKKTREKYFENLEGFREYYETSELQGKSIAETDKDYIVNEVVKKLMGELEPLFEIAQMTALDVNRIRHKVDKIRKDV